MDDIVLLEWTFKPADYFEEDINLNRDDYEVIISSGIIEARVNPEKYDAEHNVRDVIHADLNDRFLGVQLLTHKPYELSKSSMQRIHPDGRKDVTVFPEAAQVTISVCNVDLVVRDPEGNIVGDTRRDRIEKKNRLAELAEKYSRKDEIAGTLLGSYSAAVGDPNNELVHLYEIRDALSKYFGSETEACEELGLSRKSWSRLGKLSNNEPLNQGRHRGKGAGELRDATEEELQEARKISRCFIEAYLVYLDKR